MTFQVADYYKLLALHRAFMEAKFTPLPNDQDIAGSPFIAEMAHQVVDNLIQLQIEQGNAEEAEAWNKWRQIDPSRREWGVALTRAQEAGNWVHWTNQEKLHYTQILLSPFQADNHLLELFITSVDDLLTK
ncbi:MAG: hypothetical protein KJ069_24760 [Anaerolineae bacterium]|nr:hypothetical protein [Anaerolineae bacterium]